MFYNDQNTPGFHIDDTHTDYPSSDSGENFFFTIVALPFRIVAAPFRILAGIVGAPRIDKDLRGHGILDGEFSGDAIEDVLNDHAKRVFYQRRKE